MPPGDFDPSESRRRYEQAVLAALDFQPTVDPFATSAGLRPRRAGTQVALLALAHVLFAVLFAEAMANGVGGAPLLIVLAGWGTCTFLIARAVFRAGRRILRSAAPGW